MTLVVEPLTEGDLLEWTKIHFNAFYPFLTCLWTGVPTEKGFRILADGRKEYLGNTTDRVFKCVDSETNTILGVAAWKVYTEERSPEEAEESLGEAGEDEATSRETRRNMVARSAFMANIFKSRREVLGGQKAVMLGSLVVRPDWQRRGVGGKLLEWGVDEADRLGVIGYLEASQGGKGLYEKFGFKPVGEMQFDTKLYGGDIVDTHYTMIRPAKQTTTS